ncbi:hypothetical protein [Aliarcobacter butzleri]|uniref:hypothetical protein n=1 Tax=Aliarcobacter butzleri TaxID=28197 RepID=UPI0021B33F99|nr:hypothetical protein [Aliarcobacter butzleri]MCT7647551.1 hypothetical protein [Aliarcobacter butzleri]
MEFTDIIIILLASSILFEIYMYKRYIKQLKSFKGLSKLTKMVNDVDFNQKEKQLFMNYIKGSINSSYNSFIFVLLFTAFAIYLNHEFLMFTLCISLILVSLIKYIVIKKYATNLLEIYKKDIREMNS